MASTPRTPAALLALGLIASACRATPPGPAPDRQPGLPNASASTPEAADGASPARALADRVELPEASELSAQGIDPDIVARIDAAQAAVAAAPDDPATWLALGMTYHANELYEAARACYDQAQARDPAAPKPAYYQALILARRGEPGEAAAAMRQAAERAPDYAPAHWRLGQLLLDAGDPDAAGEAFDAALALDPESEAARIGQGRVALQAGQLETAVDRLQQAADMGEANADYARRLLGQAYQRLGREAEARQALAAANAGSPVWTDAWSADLNAMRDSFGFRSRAAEKLLSAGRVADGVALLETLHAERPEDLDVMVNLGAGYGQLGRYDAAASMLEAVLAARPRHAASHENLARARLFQMQAEGADREALLAQALAEIDQAIAIAPARVAAQGLRGDLLVVAERPAEAAEAYAEAARLSGRAPRWLNAEARMRLRTGQWDAVVSLLDDVTRRDPENAEAWRNLGLAQAALGAPSLARSALERAVTLDPGDTEARSALEQLESR